MKLQISKWLEDHLTEKRLLYILIFILIGTTLADLLSALTSSVFKIAETNPIYLLTGNARPLIILNIFSVIWFARNLKNSISIPKIFVFCLITLYLSVGHGFGIWSNITAEQQYQENPAVFVREVEEITTKEKVEAYSLLIGIVMLLPILIAVIAFYVAMYFYTKRQPKREKIMGEIYKLAKKLYAG